MLKRKKNENWENKEIKVTEKSLNNKELIKSKILSYIEKPKNFHKTNLWYNVPNKKKFSIINYIYIYLKNYNLKYKTKLYVHNIIQRDDSENKICYY